MELTDMRHSMKPSETTWPASVAVMLAAWPAQMSANAKTMAAPGAEQKRL